MAFIGVSYAVVLAVQDADSAVVRWLLAVGTPLVAGLLISRLLGAAASDRAQRARAVARTRTRLVLDTAPDAFITLDRDGVITNWNAAAERLFGWTRGGGDRQDDARPDRAARVRATATTSGAAR